MVARAVRLFLSRQDAPRSSSVGAVNAALADALVRLGCRVEPYQPGVPDTAEQFLPLGRAKLHSRLHATSPLDVALYDDAGLDLCPPSPRWARRTVVVYHGLAWNQGAWLGRPEVDFHCANSPYLASVLRSVLSFPDWERRRCLDARAFGSVCELTLALPCVDEPEGTLMPFGAAVPDPVRRAMDDGSAWGHALQAGKHDWDAMLAILTQANAVAREGGAPPLRLLVPEPDFRMMDARLKELVVPVPLLSQRALFEAMRSCRFGLAYNTVPESFGFYALESVYHACPVYTNGAGNTRHVLPAGHGITVLEEGDVAQRLVDDLARPAEVAAECRRGAGFIRERFDRRAFEKSVEALLARVEREAQPGPAFEELELRMSPMVRRYAPETGVLLSDLRSRVLAPGQVATLASLMGRRCGEVLGDRAIPRRDLEWLFENGILTLAPPGA